MAKASRGSDQFPLRLPDGMRDRIKAKAEENNRSMNAEIISTLEEAYPDPGQVMDDLTFFDEIDDIRAKLDRIRAARYAEELAKARVEMKELDKTIEKADIILGKKKPKP